MVFRSVFVDPDIDKALVAQAEREGIQKGVVFLRYLDKGMELARAGQPLPVVEANITLALRTVHVPYRTDEQLRVDAFHLRISKMDILRMYLRMGMEAEL